ncbi:MAG: hypothetical protein K5829_05115 [Treponema sp.]|nr:hypothetical protein [Treponema sp.]
MTEGQWTIFCNFRESFRQKVEEWKESAPELTDLQHQAALEAKTPQYPFETSVVYNRDLDSLTKASEIKLIVIGDNPGKDEQLAKNNRYLVGQAGKIADGFFKRNEELGIDFRKNVIILNKTPVHSAKTIQLKRIMKLGGPKIEKLILESQLWMAKKTAEFYSAFFQEALKSNFEGPSSSITLPELWLVGYSELKDKGFFVDYRDELKASLNKLSKGAWNSTYLFQHFSMNRFTIDLKDLCEGEQSLFAVENPSLAGKAALLEKIHFTGRKHKEEIFGS